MVLSSTHAQAVYDNSFEVPRYHDLPMGHNLLVEIRWDYPMKSQGIFASWDQRWPCFRIQLCMYVLNQGILIADFLCECDKWRLLRELYSSPQYKASVPDWVLSSRTIRGILSQRGGSGQRNACIQVQTFCRKCPCPGVSFSDHSDYSW